MDAELVKLEHRARHLAEQQPSMRCRPNTARPTTLGGSAHRPGRPRRRRSAKFEGEIDAVRQREDRDRNAAAMAGTADAKQLVELQHELETLERRQSSLEDSLLEVMERREQLQRSSPQQLSHASTRCRAICRRRSRLRDGALVDLDNASSIGGRDATSWSSRSTPTFWRSTSGSAPGRPGAGLLQARRCGACRSRSTAAKWRGSPRPPRTRCCVAPSVAQSCCGSRNPGCEGHRRGRRRLARQPGPGGLRRGGVVAPTATRCSPSASRPSAARPTTSPNTAA